MCIEGSLLSVEKECAVLTMWQTDALFVSSRHSLLNIEKESVTSAYSMGALSSAWETSPTRSLSQHAPRSIVYWELSIEEWVASSE